jgi:low affinity Fe/Cu permease
MTKKILKFFDRLEDKTRSRLSRNPLLYALLGGIGIILFWRGVWHAADELNLSSISSIIIGVTILLLSGVFVSTFIGNNIIISGIRGDKKLDEKTADEIQAEETEIENLKNSISRLEKKIDHLEEDFHQK